MSLPSQQPPFPQQQPQLSRSPQSPQGGNRPPAQARPNWGQQPPTGHLGPTAHRPMSPAQQQWNAPGAQFGRNQQWNAPAKSSGSGCGVAFGLVAIAGIGLLIFIGLVMGALVNNPDPTPTSSSTRPVATSPTSPRQSQSQQSTSPRSSASSPLSPASRSATPSVNPSPSTQPAGEYKHEGYPIPGINPNYPQPEIYDRNHGDQLAKANALYRQHLNQPIRCEIAILDYSNATQDQRMRHSEIFRECLMRTWTPLVEAAGFKMVTPELFFIEPGTQTPCGNSTEFDAFFCPNNQSIYIYPERFYTQRQPNGAVRPIFETMLAHEFGHFIQYRTGILTGSWWVVHDRDEYSRMNWSRRVELQAQCLTGMSFQATRYSMGLSDHDIQLIYEFESNRPTGEVHSSGRLLGLWFHQGTKHTRIGECNTFVVDKSLIDP